MKNSRLTIISGGQTGVDQAALRAAKICNLERGGCCPPGRVCESGLIPDDFPLYEAPYDRSIHALEIERSWRTEDNVRKGNATLILRRLTPFTQVPRDAGTTWTFECAVLYGKPLLLCDPEPATQAKVQMVCFWLDALGVEVLNVAGPAESTQPGIGQLAEAFLVDVFRNVKNHQ